MLKKYRGRSFRDIYSFNAKSYAYWEGRPFSAEGFLYGIFSLFPVDISLSKNQVFGPQKSILLHEVLQTLQKDFCITVHAFCCIENAYEISIESDR